MGGERVIIDRSAFAFVGPKRWDVVAFTSRQSPDLVVKRVVGLPGETIDIRHGNVYADGKIQRRNLRQQRAMRLLVHDTAFVPEYSRWKAGNDRSDWGFFEGRWNHAEGASGKSIDWLYYNHPANWLSDRRSPDGPITDLCYYNQGMPRLEEDVHSVVDTMLAVRASEVDGSGLLWLKLSNGDADYRVKIDPIRRKYTAFSGEKSLAEGSLPGAVKNSLLEFSIFDEQFLFAMNGRTLSCLELPERPANTPTPRLPIGIGSQGLHIVFDSLQVFRNIYYTSAPSGSIGQRDKRPIHLGGNEYYVLGDNSPISDDSRSWARLPDANPAVLSGDIVGRPLIVFYSPLEINCFDRHFQVPDLTRIRYIR
jgi:signal peptidase I